jgi:hypothetical protein
MVVGKKARRQWRASAFQFLSGPVKGACDDFVRAGCLDVHMPRQAKRDIGCVSNCSSMRQQRKKCGWECCANARAWACGRRRLGGARPNAP